MTDFNDWYAQQNPDLDPRLDDFHQEARKAYEAGANIKPNRDDAPEVDVPEGFWELSRDDRIKWGANLALARKCADDSALQAAGGLASYKTLRDKFAGQAMAAALREEDWMQMHDTANFAYEMADAMLEARKTTGDKKQ
jgi:hypothetical protein